MPKSGELPAAEIEAAAAYLKGAGSLCFVTGSITNTGFAASISFNSREFRSANGTLSLALRTAMLTFHCSVQNAEWHDEISELVRKAARTIQVKEVIAAKGADSDVTTLDAAIEGKGSFKLPLLGEMSLGSRISEGRKHDRIREQTSSSEVAFARTAHDLEMERRAPDSFRLTFRAEPESDLVRYNPQLGRVNILALEVPSEVKAEDVTVTLSSELVESDRDVRHSLRIRAATGCWMGLQASANHQIIGELLLAKLLRPLHDRTVVWPRVDQ